jgi:hypothetical protein
LELFLKIRGASCKYVAHGLISKKYKCFFVKFHEFSGFRIIFQWENVVDSVHSSRRQGLAGAWPNGCSGAQQLAVRVAMGRARCGTTRGPLFGAWTTARTWHTGGGASAPSSYGAGTKEEGRRQGEGVRCSTGV